MKLIPEQIINLRNKLLREEDPLISDYLNDLKENKADDMFKIKYADYVSENLYNMNRVNNYKIKQLLETSEYVFERDIEKINIGTRFIIRDEEYDEDEEYTLVETIDGLETNEKFISTSSPMGMSLLGKKEGELVEYETPYGKIKIKIKEIEKRQEEYIKPIRQQGKSVIEDENDQFSSISTTQNYLLLTELNKLLKNANTRNLEETKIRINTIKELLNRKKENGTEDNTIGIGTIFSIKLDNGVSIENIEMINRAYSDEFDDEYIERISPLGEKIFGLSENDTFNIKIGENEINGYVYNIKNSLTKNKTYVKK